MKAATTSAALLWTWCWEFVTTTGVSPTRILLCAPHKANVDYLEHQLALSKYQTLKGIIGPMSIDGCQGKKGEIAVLFLARIKKSGPGFTSDPTLLDVAVKTRQKSGFLIMGTLNVIEGNDMAPASSTTKKLPQIDFPKNGEEW
ncbi:hypothetical protein PspLS_03539 [Pyricularia sp. CBS 133598]|nr:hypothetical protein PspLS_03539 [Pyricularia sp. CBS 133598]